MKHIVVSGEQNKSTSIKRFSLRQILVHFIAAWLLAYAIELFGYFRNIDFLKVLMKGDDNLTIQYIKSRSWTYHDLIDYASFVNETWIIGLFLAFIISLYVAKRHRWWGINSIIAVTLVYVISFVSAHFMKNHTGHWFSTVYNFPFPASVCSFIVVGIMSTGGSCLLFFSHKIATLIEKAVPTNPG